MKTKVKVLAEKHVEQCFFDCGRKASAHTWGIKIDSHVTINGQQTIAKVTKVIRLCSKCHWHYLTNLGEAKQVGIHLVRHGAAKKAAA